MQRSMNHHLEEEELERYSMRRIPEEEVAPFEEHLLMCGACRSRLEESDIYVMAMRQASSRYYTAREKRSRPAWVFRPVWAVAFASAAAILMVSTATRERTPDPVPVTLQAMRGTAPGTRVPAQRPLLLAPDMTALPVLPSYRLEIVDANGNQIFSALMPPLPVKTGKLAAGWYFVRVLSSTGELLREYSLEAAL